MAREILNGQDVFLDGFLKSKLDILGKIIRNNWDGVLLIDGKERSGKSTLGITIGFYMAKILKGKFGIDNIAKDMEDVIKKIETFKDRSIIMMDEGSLVFSSKDAMAKAQKKLMKVMDVVGQKNMVFIVILPSVFDLNKNIAVRRSRFLLHVYTDKRLQRGRFLYFGERKKRYLYELGKKNFGSYDKPKADFYARFADFNPFGEEYQKLKRKTLLAALKDNKEERFDRQIIPRDILIKKIYDEKWMTQKAIAEHLSKNDWKITRIAINEVIKKFRDKKEKEDVSNGKYYNTQ